MTTKKRSVLIVGAGPAGVACAQESLEEGFDVTILDKGYDISERVAPCKENNIGCIKCPICSVMSGFAGAGAFSDGKWTMPQEPGIYHIGGELPSYFGYDLTNELIMKRFNYAIAHGAENKIIPRSDDFFLSFDQKLKNVGLYRAAADVNHIGTTKVQELFQRYKEELVKNGAEIHLRTKVTDLIISGKRVIGVITDKGDRFFADNVVIATGRSGALWLERIAKQYKFPRRSALADFGFRVEVPSAITHEPDSHCYEWKVIKKREDMMARSFCNNPLGAVVSENTDGVAYVNGHSDDVPLSNHTNFAVLITTPRYSQDDVRKLGAKINKAGKGQPIIQSWTDLMAGKASTNAIWTLNPTLRTATPGNFNGLFPKDELSCFIDFMTALDEVIPGVAGPQTILYGLEAKFCHPNIVVTKELRLKGWEGIFIIGDASVTHGFSNAEASGAGVVRFFE